MESSQSKTRKTGMHPVTKYRYQVLKGEIQKRCRELIMQICDGEDVRILPGAVSQDHVHMQIEYPPLSINQRLSEATQR